MTTCVFWFVAGIACALLASVGVVAWFLHRAESGDAELEDRNG